MPNSQPTTQSGFTIIEALLAIIVVGVLLVAIAPVIVLSAATRVQSRRVELGTQAARTYVDGVRAGVIDAPNSVLVPDTTSATPAGAQLSQVAAPPSTSPTCTPPTGVTTNFYCNPDPTGKPPKLSTANINLFCINFDSNNPQGCSTKGSKSFIVQAFRTALPKVQGTTQLDTTDDGSKGYILGVRVYRADGFDGNGTLRTTVINKGSKMATYAGGTGDQKSPVVEVITEIRGASASDQTNYQNLRDRIGPNPNFPSR